MNMACLNRAACDFDDRISDAKTIAEAIAPQCVSQWVSAMEARGVSPGVSYGMKEQQLRLALTAVLTKRQGRINCRR